MFDIGWQELFLIAVVALIVIGPKDMPVAMRTMARVLSKVRGLSREFQQGVSEIMREAELDEIRRKVEDAGRIDVKGEVGRMLDPDGSLRSELDVAADARSTLSEDGGTVDRQGADERRTATPPPPAATAPRSVFAAPNGELPGVSTAGEEAAPTPAAPAAAPAPPRPAREGSAEP